MKIGDTLNTGPARITRRQTADPSDTSPLDRTLRLSSLTSDDTLRRGSDSPARRRFAGRKDIVPEETTEPYGRLAIFINGLRRLRSSEMEAIPTWRARTWEELSPTRDVGACVFSHGSWPVSSVYTAAF